MRAPGSSFWAALCLHLCTAPLRAEEAREVEGQLDALRERLNDALDEVRCELCDELDEEEAEAQ